MTKPKRLSRSSNTRTLLRRLPSVDELCADPRLVQLAASAGRPLVVQAARAAARAARARFTEHAELAATDVTAADLTHELIAEIIADLERALQPSLRPVINATGVILHTNLGRAPISNYAVDHTREIAMQYSNLEYDLESGSRGARDIHTSRLLTRLTGAEAAIVVNNNAAAVFVVLAAVARGGEVIVSRGELIEIGDGFRIPDIMAESGAALREVGTTNRASLADYERAINDRTRLLLRVHRSNFHVKGFTARPTLAELVKLGRSAALPVYEDLGSGCLSELPSHGAAERRLKEPTVQKSLATGVSIVSFSGDKLLGGPQAGIIAGNREIVSRIRRHPMFRALRVDKLTIAALEATLLSYLARPGAPSDHDIPAVRMILMRKELIAARAAQIVASLRTVISRNLAKFDLRDSESVVGGGATPDLQLPTCVIAIQSAQHSATELESRLRHCVRGIPVIARVEEDCVLLDLRTVFPEQETALVETLTAALKP